MTRMMRCLLSLTALACASLNEDGYEVRVSSPSGVGKQKIQVDGAEIELSVSPLSRNRRNVDVKAKVRNTGFTSLTLTSVGAQLEAESQSWEPVAWKAFWADSIVANRVVLEPEQECGILCSFQIGSNPRERFPKTLRFTMGALLREGRQLELGAVELYLPE